MSRFSKIAMSKEKRALLDKMLQDEGLVSSGVSRIEKRSGERPVRLSSSQQRLWFLDKMEPNSTSYNMPYQIELQGALDVQVLESALNEIIERHEILRTTFAAQDGKTAQVVHSMQPVAMPLVQADRAELPRLALAEAQKPFSLTAGPLLRAKLVQTGERAHTLLLTLHHIVFDGWSMNLLLQELSALYAAFAKGAPSPLADLPLQYGDYAEWQQEWLNGEGCQKQLDYWKATLSGAPVVLDLPTDRPRPVVQTHRGGNVGFALSKELAEQLKAWSRQEDVTLFMTLFSAFSVLLSRYSGQEDLLIGAPFAGRSQREAEGLIGFFVNTLVLRADLTGNPAPAELVRRVKDTVTGALSHQELPFDRLVEELQPARDASRSPLFQAMFNFLDAPHEELRFGGLALTHGEVLNGTAKFDLTLYVEDGSDGIRGNFEYNADLFEQATVERMAGHFRTLLEGIASRPELPVSELPLLTDAEWEQAVHGWNDTKTPYPQDRCIHQLFEAQAQRQPDAVATVYGGTALTYAELNVRANQLAHHLRRNGIGPDALVGLSVERSHDMVIGMLGILKAGGAYVPLDPAYPQERLSFMQEDTGIRVVVAQEQLVGNLPQSGLTMICLDRDAAQIAAESTENPEPLTGVEHLAYVLYTSGSTGVPKGVLVPHRAINRLVCNTDFAQLDATDVIGQVSNSSFDAVTFEIWGALANGGRIVGVGKEIALMPKEFAEEIKSQGITAMFLTSALFNQLAGVVPDAFSQMRHLLVGGEAVDARFMREVIKHGAPKRLLNAYGPTESTTFATWQDVYEMAFDALSIPIGKPIANTSAYVLDAYLQPVPVGVPGELYLGGDGVARGYLNRQELTAERFLQNPFAAGLLYKTGDLVCRLPNGAIEYISRLDHQVKVRGFRIELGEIEQALGALGNIRDVIAVVREDEPGDKRVVAYVVPERTEGFSAQELRGLLKEKLPEYMLPSAILALEALPLTVNGKVDRHALPHPQGLQSQSAEYAAPRTEMEEIVLSVWQQVLGVECIGIHDNFFDLGGHSLLLIQVHEGVQEKLQTQFSIVELFRHTTVYTLTKFLSQQQAQEPAKTAGRAEESQARAQSKKDVLSRRKQLSKGRGK
ncbi:amino acid adenylation domain-containing protein [Tumebacillus sp. BK434]|uniref:non-ribosomal peptide synthetase n=1 Tax=Tumebacillus sp. BK434 TaxID=2512169 RepID=UPI001047D6FF|nr:non-ribosomal peptide synthetase [Tumebacillus sp. BK434]TCP54479.1 amino acid adenylation domain-containing protein [Tumebacillus sp. BK434]